MNSLAALARWPHTVARKSGGEPFPLGRASSGPIGVPVWNARSSSAAVFAVRDTGVGAPSTTAISFCPPWVAEATRLYPAGQVKPVFMPSAPG